MVCCNRPQPVYTVPMPLDFQIEKLSQALPEMERLFAIHWNEVANDKDKIPLDMWIEQYQQLENWGQLHIITVRNTKELVGYHWSIIRPHLHYKHSLTAYTDGYYLHPAYRKGRNGVNLFKFAEKSLKEKGVKKMYTASKVNHDKSAIFESLGWTLAEKVYTKYIG